MTLHRSTLLGVSAAALLPGTTVRYHYRDGNGLATVVDRTDRYVTFVGEECNGIFTFDQIDRLIADERLQIVLDDETHVPSEGLPERLQRDSSDRTK